MSRGFDSLPQRPQHPQVLLNRFFMNGGSGAPRLSAVMRFSIHGFYVIRLTQPDAFFEQSYCCPAGRDSSSHLDALPCQIREGFSLKQSIQDIMETNFSHLKASKVCTCCKIEKPLSEFGKNVRAKDGHNIYCKVCQNEKIRESRERRKNTLPPPAALPAPDASSKLLKDCTPRELILELKNRGYKGRLVWQPPMPQPIVINIEEFN